MKLRNILAFFLAFLCISLFSGAEVKAATYYVSQTDGNDSYDGLEQIHASGSTGPFKTMAKLAGFGFAAGDQILLKKGDVWRETWYVNTGGSSGSPITYGSYGTSDSKPRITGTDLVTGWTLQSGNIYKANFTNSIDIYLLLEDSTMATPVGSLGAITGERKFWFDDTNNVVYYWASDGADPDTHIMEIGARYDVVSSDDREYITFDGLQIDGAGGQYGRGFGLKPTWFTPDNITLQNMRITNNYYSGVWMSYATNFTPISNFKIYSSDIDHNGVFGLRIEGQSTSYRPTGFRLDGSRIYNNGLNTSIGQIGIWLNYLSAPIITGNTIHDSQGSLDWSDNLYIGSTINALVQYNTVYTATRSNIHFDVDSNGFICRYNVTYGATWNGIWVEEHLRANGVSYIYNNTSYGNLHGFVFGPGGTGFVVSGVVVKNNIFAYNTRASDDLNNTTSDNDVDYNLYYTDSNAQGQFRYNNQFVNFSTWKMSTGWDTHSTFSEPAFLNRSLLNFNLSSESPARNAGTNLSLTSDFNGYVVPSEGVPDIGAYEYYEYVTSLPHINNSSVCIDKTPIGVPDLFQIDKSSNSVKLYFTTLRGNVTGYDIMYGFSPNDERFATTVKYNGPLWILNTTIDHLNPKTTYYFKVRPVNGCVGGSFSNVKQVKTLPKSIKVASSQSVKGIKIEALQTSTPQPTVVPSREPTIKPIPTKKPKSCFLFICW